jgi:hypothetical protein
MNVSRNIVDNDRKNNRTMCVMDTNDKPRKTFYKMKKITWTFHLNNALLKTMKTHFEWTIHEIALTFVHENSRLGLNITQIKKHLKILNVKEKLKQK